MCRDHSETGQPNPPPTRCGRLPAVRCHHPHHVAGETFRVAGVSMTARSCPGTRRTPRSTPSCSTARSWACGDIAFGRNEVGRYTLGLLSNLWQSDLDLYVSTLRRLTRTPIELPLPGHGAAVAGRDAVRAAREATLAIAERLAGDFHVRRSTGT